MSALAQLVTLQPKPLQRIETGLLRRLLSGRSLEELTSNALLARAVRFPILEEFFELALPGGATVCLHAESAPYLFWSGFHTFEPTVVPAFSEYVAGAASFVDVGAAFGFYSLLARSLEPSLRIAAVEPNPHHADILRATFARNAADIELFEAALLDGGGVVELSLAGGLSSVEPSRWRDNCEHVLVEAVAFDELFHEPPDLVKIDVEGAEIRVLAGMGRTLAQARTTIFAEIAPENLRAAAELVGGYGYTILELPERRPADLKSPVGADYLLVPVRS